MNGEVVNGRRASNIFTDPRVRALAVAAARGDAAEVARLVAGGADPNAVGREAITPLIWAMGPRSHAGVRALLAHGANPNATGPDGFDPLTIAAGSTDREMLKLLLEAGGDANAAHTGEPLLSRAVLDGTTENVEVLVTHGANVDATDDSHDTAANAAAASYQWDKVAYLLEHGADPTIPNLVGLTVANTLESASAPTDPAGRASYEHARRALEARGVRSPAESPTAARRRVFGPNNPVDQSITHDRAVRDSLARTSTARAHEGGHSGR